MADQVIEPPLKRKRVAAACDSCRSRKAKCDNRRPICGRCEGYGHQCTWHGGRRRAAVHDGGGSGSGMAQSPHHSVHESFELLRHLCLALPANVHPAVDELLAHVETHGIDQDSPADVGKDAASMPSSIGQPRSSRYLGEASDIHFLNLAKQTFRAPGSATSQPDEAMENYDQEETSGQPRPLSIWLMDTPGWTAGEEYLSIYFSTIHIAYPFLPRSIFMRKYKNLVSNQTSDDPPTAAWLALFYGVLAIGAFYDSFVSQGQSPPPSKDLHVYYFRRSILLTDLNTLEASAVQVSALLAQCFYLLATSKTDRCWITLGVAIRLAQALGLHMGFVEAKSKPGGYLLPLLQRAEIRRRIWYSLYVLDRLVALQVGRPSAISDDGFCVAKPSNLDDIEHDWESDEAVPSMVDEPSSGSYFLHMIELSKLIGHVLQELNGPPKPIDIRISRTNHFDNELSGWKHKLPRFLRFDVVHVFDHSRCFKRQRNMLAVKYHHLRALMHRPYLSWPLSNRPVADTPTESQMTAMKSCSQICISEARKTAHLFHNVQDQTQLVCEYPWWQLISCVVCAASILIVAGTVQESGVGDTGDGLLRDDAQTCLKVLEALGSNSTGALNARDLMAKLLSQCEAFARGTASENSGYPARALDPSSGDLAQLGTTSTNGDVLYDHGLAVAWPQMDDAFLAEDGDALPWPYGTLNSMAWSSQVLNSMITPADLYLPAALPETHDGTDEMANSQ